VRSNLNLKLWECKYFCVKEVVAASGTPTGLHPEIKLKDPSVRQKKLKSNLINNNMNED
jgi:hypothetical protein